jgi:prolyl oligopeptidase
VVAALLGVLLAAPARSSAFGPVVYPETTKGDVVDDYHGTKVPDPYRWLENPDSPESRAWIAAQNKLTFGFLADIPARDRIKERLTKLWDFERFGTPFKEGGRYFLSRNTGLQNQNVWFWTDSLQGELKGLIDPNTLAADGTVSLGSFDITDDGKLMAYSLQGAGSDWSEIKVREIDSGKDRPDHLKWVKFSSPSWTKDGQGFFYSRYDEPKGDKLTEANYFHKLYYHKLGTPQSEDVLICDNPNEKEWGFGGGVSEDGRYLIVSVWKGTERKNLVYYKDLTNPNSEIVQLITKWEAQYDFLGNDGGVFWFKTDDGAPRYRVVAIDTAHPTKDKWRELIPQTKDTLQGVNVVGNSFICEYLADAKSLVKVHDLTGKHVRDVALPGIGSAGGFGGKRSDTETFYAFTSFTWPTTIFRYDIASGESTIFKQPKVDFDADAYETKQVFYKSKDGTRVPMFITHKKGLALNGQNPTLLYAYGGFNISVTPSFSVSNAAWLELGGVYAVANIRGGGEYGKEWHDAGKLANKQNCFDDFIAAGEWLIANGYTSSPKLAIAGGSNGGLLVGACITQRPELFGAALPAVGVMDMLRFHKFTIGWAWASDYGNAENPADFATLMKYSPLHNIRPGTAYPATMITTADHDDRVVPAHSFKFAAALQAAQSGPSPALIRIETKAGHGAGKPTTKIIEEAADRWAFLVQTLNMETTATPPKPAAPAQ